MSLVPSSYKASEQSAYVMRGALRNHMQPAAALTSTGTSFGLNSFPSLDSSSLVMCVLSTSKIKCGVGGGSGAGGLSVRS